MAHAIPRAALAARGGHCLFYNSVRYPRHMPFSGNAPSPSLGGRSSGLIKYELRSCSPFSLAASPYVFTHFLFAIFLYSILGQFTRNYTQTVKRAADNKRRYAPGWVHSTCLLRGVPKGAAPHLAHDFAEQSVVCYTLCRRCPENTVAAGEGKGI